MSSRSILVAVAWPYAQGPLHLGHMAGAYLPADIFARYHRAAGNEVLMVSGSDVHGTPITVRAEAEGVSPEDIVNRYHPEFLGYWRDLGISFDLFTTTGTDNHRDVAHDMFFRLRDKGFLYKDTMEQAYDPEAERFLPDRYVEGTCPHCGYEAARGDQCDNCGRTLDPTDLIEPRSTLTGATPERRETEHYFLKLSALQDDLLDWLKGRAGWRRHVLNFSIGFTEDGLNDRAFTRDLDWGIPVPVDDLGPGKVIYVWWEAVMGYLSAAKEWAKAQGTPEAWKEWWEDPGAGTYYFIGKDNILFHAVFWPAMLIGYGGLNLPTDVPANQFITFRGEKASKSRGVGRPLTEYLAAFQPDSIRYALAANLPEQQDSDITDAELVRRINEELVATWGNLAHRVVSMIHRYFGGQVPEPGDLGNRERAVLEGVDAALKEVAAQIEAVELKAGLASGMASAQAANAYLNATEPWNAVANDPAQAGSVLWTAANAVAGINIALSPYLPFGAEVLHTQLGFAGSISEVGWARPELSAGTPLGPAAPLFSKVDGDA